MVGPYGRQLTHTFSGGAITGRLKFWFAFRNDDGTTDRYEAMIGKGDRTFKIRNRPIFAGRAPRYSANFHDFRIPEDLTAYPAASFPRFRRDKIADAAMALLQSEDIADVTRIRLVGTLPTRQAWQPNGDPQCTLNLLL